MERKWLVVRPRHDGLPGRYAFGVFIADSDEEAKNRAEEEWELSWISRLEVFEVADMNDGWVYYI